MGEYALEIKASARKELEELPNRVLANVFVKLEGLAAEPRPAGCRKLRGFKSLWRIRVGDWRVVYQVDDDGRIVTITRVAHRREVYDR